MVGGETIDILKTLHSFHLVDLTLYVVAISFMSAATRSIPWYTDPETYCIFLFFVQNIMYIRYYFIMVFNCSQCLQVILTIFYFFFAGSASSLIETSGFLSWLSYGVMMITVFVLRKQLPEANRPFRVRNLPTK